jgi:HYDIN/CFA65/VesB family protein
MRLDESRRGQVTYTVTNTSHQNLRARAHVVAESPASQSWFNVPDAERNSPVDSTQQFVVEVAVPPDVAPGKYRFHLDVADVGSPDEFSAQGPGTSIEVPETIKVARPVPWLWIGLAVLALLVVIGGGIAVFALTRPKNAALQVQPSSADFGFVIAGSPVERAFTVKNAGDGQTGVVATISGDQDFSVAPGGCGTKLSKGDSCTLRVVFQSRGAGSRQATLMVHAESGADPAPVLLKGNGLITIGPLPTPTPFRALRLGRL